MKILFVLLALAVSARAATPVADLLGGRAPTAILRTMPSDTPPNQRLDGLAFIAGYEAIGAPVPIPAEKAAALAARLKDPGSTDAENNDEHMRPGVAYRFGAGADAVDVLVCFSCDKIAVLPAGAPAITETFHLTQATRDVLLDLAKQLLPEDEAIQELPRVRRVHPAPPPDVPVPADAPRPGQPLEN